MTERFDTPEEEAGEFSQHCCARECAVQVLDAALWLAIAAGMEPEEIEAVVESVLGPDEPGEITADTPTEGSA